jgi:hypothetical protein
MEKEGPDEMEVAAKEVEEGKAKEEAEKGSFEVI